MKRNLRAQMVGFHHRCVDFSESQSHDYYEFLHEADEFGAAAGTYPDERDELLANSAHRYQLLVDWTTAHLKLNVSFLNKGKIWFNFYSDIATHFGLGTQAYTTETKRPHIGISEISLQDMNLLQLILLHEMQHAIDFSNYAGLQMTISERELRARISICEGLSHLRETQSELYGHAVQDLCYWFIMTYLTPGTETDRKRDYYDLLNEDVRYLLSSEGGGIHFSPLVLRSLAKELQRDNLTLNSTQRYAINSQGDDLHLRLLSLDSRDQTEEAADPLELMLLEDDKLAPQTIQLKQLSKVELGSLAVDYSREVVSTRNKISDWQSYDKSYEKLKTHAKEAIERDKPSFAQVQLRLEKGAGHTLDRSLFPQVEAFVQAQPEEDASSRLAKLALPDAVQKADQASDDDEMTAIGVRLEPLQGIKPRHTIEEELTLEDRMSDLSDFVKERGAR